jgi:hypothetical protein
MHLKLVANAPSPKFEIYDDDQVVAGIKIDLQMQALRLTYREIRRVFFITEERLRKGSQLNLLNEYSQPLGTLIKNKSNTSGEMEIEGLKLNFNIADNGGKEVNLYEKNKPVLSCKIQDEALLFALENINYLLFAFMWYTFLLKEQKPVLQVA